MMPPFVVRPQLAAGEERGVATKPPSVVLADRGAEVQFDGIRQFGIEWTQVTEIAIEVVVDGEGYSEAFWKLTGPGVEFGAPVELVGGARDLRARLLAFPGFDHVVYERAREAEAKAAADVFVCWRA